jgi:hypothetical protein
MTSELRFRSFSSTFIENMHLPCAHHVSWQGFQEAEPLAFRHPFFYSNRKKPSCCDRIQDVILNFFWPILFESESKINKVASACCRAFFLNQADDEMADTLENIRERVTSLNLSETPLARGSLSDIAAFFPHVKKLSLHDCPTLTDDKTEELVFFRNLEELNVGGTKISGFSSLPKKLKRLSCFRCDKLSDRHLLLLKFSNIQKLDVGETPLKGAFFHLLPKSLKELSCGGCDNIEEMPKSPQYKIIKSIELPAPPPIARRPSVLSSESEAEEVQFHLE